VRIADHVTKARRIEKTMKRKLDRDADYEIFVETCMLAGTHWLNALLHKLAITAESSDLLHSDKPPLPGPIAAELQPYFAAMKLIEDLRPGYLRGTKTWSADDGRQCMECYQRVKAYVQKALA
jgi:hypothetical protein